MDQEDMKPQEEETVRAFEESRGLNPIALAVAGGAGLLGAAIWAVVAYQFDYEIGWLAWGIGAAIGGAFFKFGGGGTQGAIACGVIAALSIIGGKYFAYNAVIDREASSFLMDMEYGLRKSFADSYVEAETDEEREALIRDWLDEGDGPSSVTDQAMATFRNEELPGLLAIQSGETTREDFEAEMSELIRKEAPFSAMFSGFDLLWMFLGIGTAFKLALGPD